VWHTELPAPRDVEFGGIVEMRASTGFAVRQKHAWRPTSWDMRIMRDPLVVDGSLAVVGLGEYSSGIGCRVALSLETGRVAWTTAPGPWSHTTPVADAWFLGLQGYGAFEVRKLSENGSLLDTWPSDGFLAPLPSGVLHVIELDNAHQSRCASALLPGGIVRRGPQLSGYYTSRPVMTANGDVIFWRADELHAVDARLGHRTLARAPAAPHEYPSRMGLAPDGTLAFTLGDALWVAASEFVPARSR